MLTIPSFFGKVSKRQTEDVMSTKYLCALCGNAEDASVRRVVLTFERGSICNICFQACAREFQKKQTHIVVSPAGQQTPPPVGTPIPARIKIENPIAKVVDTLLRPLKKFVFHFACPVGNRWNESRTLSSSCERRFCFVC